MKPLPAALIELADAQDSLFTREQALTAGLPSSSLDDRVGVSDGRPLPTVYAAFTGGLSRRQRLRAAVLYGRIGGTERTGMLSGLAACYVHGLRAARGFDQVELMLPHARKLASVDFVVVRRTLHPSPAWQLDGLPVCSPARAVVDAARRLSDLDGVRNLVAEAVQSNKCTVAQLAAELEAGGSAGSRLTRSVLAEVADGVASVAEGWLHELIASSSLPPPLWNRDLFDQSGTWLGRPDALWMEANLVAEVESREWHLSPETWAATMARTNRLGRLGLTVQQFPPSRIKSQPAAVLAELREAYTAGLRSAAGTAPLPIVVGPARTDEAA